MARRQTSSVTRVSVILATGLAFVFLSLSGAVPGAYAQSMEPRAYTNAPVGMNFLIVGYSYIQGDVLLDPSIPLTDADVRIHSLVLAYSRMLDLWGRSGNISVVLPYSWLSASGTLESTGASRTRNVSGPADPALRFSVNLYGGPALSLEEFKKYRQDTIVGLGFVVSAPLGDYDPNKLVNIGTNRWSFKPEIGISHDFGNWSLEGVAGVTFYSDNNDFFGGQKREQDPIYSVQAHAIYTFESGVWVSLGGTYYTGGATTINGVSHDDKLSNWRWGFNVAVPVNRYNSIKLFGSRGAYTRTGGDFDMIGLAWQIRWGAGL
ncbi:MAG: transporter [Deltaproteobacteria bacterium]|nr:transporter [Deltaproteobacteria bacterium]